MIPEGLEERCRFILHKIELDNIRDIEDPFVCLSEDLRKHKVNKVPKSAVPDTKTRNQNWGFEDAEFWFLKGYDHAELGEMDGAIDSYRHAISLNQEHAEAMSNLAGQYEAQQRYAAAAKWYRIAIAVSPDLLDAYYGYAVCQFKDGKALDAAEHLSIAIDKLGGAEIAKRSQRHKIYFRYLRSLCYRVLQDFEKS